MMNCNFNGMNAHDIANKIVSTEKAYLNTDYEALSFEDKCRYALDYTPIVHPILAPNPKHRAALLEALRPELLSRTEREDGFSLYVLGSANADLSAPATDAERRLLERAVKAGHAPAATALVDRFFKSLDDKKLRKQALHEYLIPTLNRLTEEGEQDAATIYAVKTLLSHYETNASARLVFYGTSRELAAKLVCEGSYVGLAKLCNTRAVSDGLLEVAPLEEEIAFWVTVDFLVHSQLYDLGARHLADALGMKLINERGCERDAEKIKEIYLDLLLSRTYDRKRLLEIVGVPHGEDFEDLTDAERECRRQIKDGKTENYRRLILIALLSGDREKLEEACDEACAFANGLLVANVAKAYHMLRQA